MQLAELIVCNVTSDGTVLNFDNFVNIPLGLLYLCESIIYLVLYIPCLIAMFGKNLIKNSCYKILAAMGVVDIICLINNALFSAFMSIFGMPYCGSYYIFIKIAGGIANGGWVSYCGLCLVLGLNRAAEMHSQATGMKLFGRNNVYKWMALGFAWGFIWGCAFLSPYASLIYHSGIGFWLFDPDIKGFPLGLWMNTFSNCTTPCVMVAFYVYVLYKMKMKSSGISAQAKQQGNISNMESAVTLQAAILCMNTALCAFSYVLVPRFFTTPMPFLIANLFWQLNHGGNVAVYIGLNKSIRKRVFAIFVCKCGELKANNTVVPFSTAKGVTMANPPKKVFKFLSVFS